MRIFSRLNTKFISQNVTLKVFSLETFIHIIILLFLFDKWQKVIGLSTLALVSLSVDSQRILLLLSKYKLNFIK